MKKDNTMEYAQILCFLGEIYRDMELSPEAIESLARAIEIHEKAEDLPGTMSGVSGIGKD